MNLSQGFNNNKSIIDLLIIDLVRHGQSEGNLKKIIQGQHDLPLTELGREQAKELGRKLESSYTAAYASPLSRAYQTAELAIKESGLNLELRPMDELMEMNFGVLQGQLFKEDDAAIRETFRKGRSDPSFRFEGGESGIEFVARIKNGIKNIIGDSNGNSHLLIVTHGGVIQVFNKIFLDIDEKVVENISISRFEYKDGKFIKH